MNLISNYKVITVTHHNLELNEIANFYVQRDGEENLYPRLSELREKFNIDECLYLETCNRVSYIMLTSELYDEKSLQSFFKAVNPALDPHVIRNIRKYVTVYSGEFAVRHVFELASSMDSLVVGEREIFRQFRKAYDKSRQHGLTGDKLRILEKATVKTAKSIYHNTGIGEKALSVVSLAMQCMKEKNINQNARILLVGSGETNSLVAKFLKKYMYSNIAIYNRSIDNAQKLSEELTANAYHISELNKLNANFDVIFICTAANKVIIDLDLYREIIGKDKSKKLIIDLAVPRNVDERISSFFNVDYIDMESLRELSEENLKYRQQELIKARPFIEASLKSFVEMFHQRNIESHLVHIPDEIRSVKNRALNLVYRKRLEKLDSGSRELVEEMMNYMEKKCISVPMRLAKESVRKDQRI